MSRKIVVITGSPRQNGNSFAMTEAFVKSAEQKGHSVVRYDAAMMNVKGCRACEACFKTGRPCSFDDDFNIVAKDIMSADVVVFTMPVYWYTIPAQLKAVIDKLFSFCTAGIDLSGKECALLACCEEEDMSVFDGVKFSVERTAALLKWRMVGQVLVPGVYKAGDILKTDACSKASALAELL